MTRTSGGSRRTTRSWNVIALISCACPWRAASYVSPSSVARSVRPSIAQRARTITHRRVSNAKSTSSRKRYRRRSPESASISVAPWPGVDSRARDPEALTQFGLVQELVSAIRAIRAEYGVQPGQMVRAVVSEASKTAATALKQERSTVIRLAKLSELSLGVTGERVGGHAVLSDGTAVFVPLGDAIDVGRECGRLGTEVDRLRRLVESQEKKLGNEQFVSRAPTDVVERERQKLSTWKDQLEVLVKKFRSSLR